MPTARGALEWYAIEVPWPWRRGVKGRSSVRGALREKIRLTLELPSGSLLLGVTTVGEALEALHGCPIAGSRVGQV
jgi:hypothetical protein